ncbi:MAG: hypothetical protein QOF76_1326 [Solirubrobacteraceae bacterium]|jgi:hypothetical protein|nr:hypothetical protein [Solirubrobacteraceae bacterium]
MKLPATAHTSQPWRIHAIASDFRLEDVWLLPGPTDVRDALARFTRYDPARSSSGAVRALFGLRSKLGDIFGWDDVADAPSLRDRVPAELRTELPRATPFSSLYLTEDEWAGELANKTVHGVLHLGRVDGHVQLAILVKPNGLFGRAYMAAIKPFRHLIIYPRLLREAGGA